MNKRHYEHTLPNIRGSLSNTYECPDKTGIFVFMNQSGSPALCIARQYPISGSGS